MTTVRYILLAIEFAFVNTLLIKKTAALIASGKLTLVRPFYSYLTCKYITPAAYKALVRRIRKAIIKCIIFNNILIVIEAFVSLAAAKQLKDQEYSFTRLVYSIV